MSKFSTSSDGGSSTQTATDSSVLAPSELAAFHERMMAEKRAEAAQKSKPAKSVQTTKLINIKGRTSVVKSLYRQLETVVNKQLYRTIITAQLGNVGVRRGSFLFVDRVFRIFLLKVASRLRDFIAARPDFTFGKGKKTVAKSNAKTGNTVRTGMRKKLRTSHQSIRVHDVYQAVAAVLKDCRGTNYDDMKDFVDENIRPIRNEFLTTLQHATMKKTK